MKIENNDEKRTRKSNFIMDLNEHAILDNFNFLARIFNEHRKNPLGPKRKTQKNVKRPKLGPEKPPGAENERVHHEISRRIFST